MNTQNKQKNFLKLRKKEQKKLNKFLVIKKNKILNQNIYPT